MARADSVHKHTPITRETVANASSISLPGGTVGWLWNLRSEQDYRAKKVSLTTHQGPSTKLQHHHCLMGQGYPPDQHIDSESIKTVPDKHHLQVAGKAKPRTCHSNTKYL